MFSYPLTIYPTNVILDSIVFDRIIKMQEGSTKRYWYENFLRVGVLMIGLILAVFFYDKLDKVLAASGTLLGTTVVLLVPTLCHIRIIGWSLSNLLIAAYALLFLFVGSGFVFKDWDD
jgi:hypothetical protein